MNGFSISSKDVCEDEAGSPWVALDELSDHDFESVEET